MKKTFLKERIVFYTTGSTESSDNQNTVLVLVLVWGARLQGGNTALGLTSDKNAGGNTALGLTSDKNAGVNTALGLTSDKNTGGNTAANAKLPY